MRRILLGLLTVTLCSATTFAADHFDAPALAGMGDVDIADLYAFQSPTDPNNTVMIMTVNPFAGAVSGTTFREGASYDFQVDNNGDAVADVTYSAQFTNTTGGQNMELFRNGMTVASGSVGMATSVGMDGALQAGVFDDPFFFDLAGFQNNLMFTGDDAFAGANVSAIVLEVPSTELGGPNVGIWASTVVGGSQVDRIGRPAINTVLIPSSRKDEFNQTSPDADAALFAADVQAAIEGLNGGDPAHAATLTGILLPDVLTIDTSDPSGFLNGRQLVDDVIDAELTLLTNSATPIGDGVDMNGRAIPGRFPYLAPAQIPEPASGLAVLLCLPLLGLCRRR